MGCVRRSRTARTAGAGTTCAWPPSTGAVRADVAGRPAGVRVAQRRGASTRADGALPRATPDGTAVDLGAAPRRARADLLRVAPRALRSGDADGVVTRAPQRERREAGGG